MVYSLTTCWQVLMLAEGKGHDSKDVASNSATLGDGDPDRYMHAQRVRMIDFCVVWTIDVCRQERCQILKVSDTCSTAGCRV